MRGRMDVYVSRQELVTNSKSRGKGGASCEEKEAKNVEFPWSVPRWIKCMISSTARTVCTNQAVGLGQTP
ncbi:hypothetical protein Naga_100213g3 [Nannochloropsis gaditana]|uniref:Uncharacterized protein n=1 Tax=Nannochloropsis gaditana TaxID=72520 RepID=W7T437_9STRA|nr:hypothetical protein Naga_100213g3 [Nannochloropsis gaditana]